MPRSHRHRPGRDPQRVTTVCAEPYARAGGWTGSAPLGDGYRTVLHPIDKEAAPRLIVLAPPARRPCQPTAASCRVMFCPRRLALPHLPARKSRPDPAHGRGTKKRSCPAAVRATGQDLRILGHRHLWSAPSLGRRGLGPIHLRAVRLAPTTKGDQTTHRQQGQRDRLGRDLHADVRGAAPLARTVHRDT